MLLLNDETCKFDNILSNFLDTPEFLEISLK